MTPFTPRFPRCALNLCVFNLYDIPTPFLAKSPFLLYFNSTRSLLLSPHIVNLTCEAGSWDSVANHQANIYNGSINASEAIYYYIDHGVARPKIILGIPLYGRSFMNTQGPGQPFSGIGQGTWEQGVYDYRTLPLPGSHVSHDEGAKASWAYDYQKKEMVSYDDEQVGKWKGEWIREEGLGGSMFWELSGDKGPDREGTEHGPGKEPQPGGSLVRTVKEAMGGRLDQSPNWLGYEGSQFDNMRKGMN